MSSTNHHENKVGKSVRVLTLFIVISVCIILTFEVLNIVYRDEGVWLDVTVGRTWCEAENADITKFMIEPVNARSDYVYMIMGTWIVFLGIHDWYDCIKVQKRKTSTATTDDEKQRPTQQQQQPPGQQKIQQHLQQVVLKVNAPPMETEEESSQMQSSSSHEVRNVLLTYPHLSIVHGIFNILHGFGSWWSHACECDQGGSWDSAGMLAVVVFSVLYIPITLVQPTLSTAKLKHQQQDANMSYYYTNNSVNEKQRTTSMIVAKSAWTTVLAIICSIGQVLIWFLSNYNEQFYQRYLTVFNIFVVLNICFYVLLILYRKFYTNRREKPHDITQTRNKDNSYIDNDHHANDKNKDTYDDILGNKKTLSVSSYQCNYQHRVFLFFFALLCFILAIIAWQLDVRRILCDPNSWLQGHAFWHFFTCLSLLAMYYFFRWEVITVNITTNAITDETDLEEQNSRAG